MDDVPLGQLKRKLIGTVVNNDTSTWNDLQTIDHMSRSDVTDQLLEQREKIEEKKKEIQNLEKEYEKHRLLADEYERSADERFLSELMESQRIKNEIKKLYGNQNK